MFENLVIGVMITNKVHETILSFKIFVVSCVFANTCMSLNRFLRILELCQRCPKGVTDADLVSDMPDCDAQQRVQVVNRLLSTVSSYINIF